MIREGAIQLRLAIPAIFNNISKICDMLENETDAT
jgi:hypothetical protein